MKFIVTLVFSIQLFAQNYMHPYQLSLKKIADDVYVIYRPDHLRASVEGNVTVIINDDHVLVVDGSSAPAAAKNAIAYIKQLSPLPVRFLINTHGHGDHTLGNEEYLKTYPGVQIIAHPKTREYMMATEGGISYVKKFVERGLDSARKFPADESERIKKEAKPGYQQLLDHYKRYAEYDLPIIMEERKKLTIIPPTMTVDGELTFYNSKREIRVFYMGFGNTDGDLWIYLPNEKILCSGDAVVHPIPYGYSFNQTELLNTLRKAVQMDFEILIPGHGDVQYDKRFINLYIEFLDYTLSEVDKRYKKGVTADELIKTIDVNDFERRFAGTDPVLLYYFHGYTFQPTVNRYLAQLEGQ